MRPAQLLHRHIAAQPGEHDLELLLRRERPVLPLLAQPDLLLLVERPILRGAPDAIAAPPRPYLSCLGRLWTRLIGGWPPSELCGLRSL